MKKIFIILTIFVLTLLPAYSAQQVEETYNDVLNINEKFFEAPILPSVKVVDESKKPAPKSNHLPFFQKTRLKIQYALKMREKRAAEKRARFIKPQSEFEVTDEDIDDIEVDFYNSEFGEQFSEHLPEQKPEQHAGQPAEQQAEQPAKEPAAITGGVKTQTTESEMMLDCDNVKVNEKTGEIEATGSPVLILPSQGIKLSADKMIYNQASNILKATGNVVLDKGSMPVYGDYIQINMNEENVFMDNIIAKPSALNIKAKNALSENGKLVLTEGKIYSEKSNKFNFITRMMGPDFTRMIISDEDKNLLMSDETAKLRIVADSIDVKARKDHDTVQLKDAEVYYNDKYLFKLPSFTAHTNKEQEYVEMNYPELGAISRFGMFAGPGFVFDTPFGSTLKVAPIVNYKDEFGIGGAAKFKTAFNDTQIMYGTGSDIFMVKGKQKLDDNLFLQYGSNAYMDDWFMGRRMPKYLAELVYDKNKTLKDFLVEGKDLSFRHRVAAGFAHDGEWNMHTENIKSTNLSTTRFKYMAQVGQSLYKYENKEKRKAFELSLVAQGSAALYGTGDTQFVGRLGPRIHTQYKYWMQDIGYFLSAFDDNTPMPVFDMYRYGRSNVYIREAIRLNKFLTVGWSGSVTLTNDAPNGNLFQENAFIFSIGPDDFKVNLGYDFMRGTTYFTVAMMFDTKGTEVTFNKLVIKDPERLGHSDTKHNDNIAFEETGKKNKAAKRLEYAQVIDIEDPNKEDL